MPGQQTRAGEHEAMRKIKNEFMTHWDGLLSKPGERILGFKKMDPIVSISLVSIFIGALIALVFLNSYFHKRRSEVVSISKPELLHKPSKPKKPHSKLHTASDKVEVDLALSAHANARRWYEMKKRQESKQEKTVTTHEKAFKAAEKKTRFQLSQIYIRRYAINFLFHRGQRKTTMMARYAISFQTISKRVYNCILVTSCLRSLPKGFCRDVASHQHTVNSSTKTLYSGLNQNRA